MPALFFFCWLTGTLDQAVSRRFRIRCIGPVTANGPVSVECPADVHTSARRN
jgi:hypothetical protein